MDNQTEYYQSLLDELDSLPGEVTTWEAAFIESLMEKGCSKLSAKQKAIIDRMKEKYLA